MVTQSIQPSDEDGVFPSSVPVTSGHSERDPSGVAYGDGMPRVPAVSSRASDRRTRLLLAAVDVLSKRGFEAATIEEITRAAGVAKGSFYREFSSKEDLAVAMQQGFFQEVMARATAIASRLGAEDIWALADEFIEMIVDAHLENRDIAAVLMKEASVKGQKDFAHADERMNEIVTMGIRVGVATGEFDCDDPETVASILIHGIEGVLHHAMLYNDDVDRERVLAAAKHVMRRSLGAKS